MFEIAREKIGDLEFVIHKDKSLIVVPMTSKIYSLTPCQALNLSDELFCELEESESINISFEDDTDKQHRIYISHRQNAFIDSSPVKADDIYKLKNFLDKHYVRITR